MSWLVLLFFLWLSYFWNKRHFSELKDFTLPVLFLLKIGVALFFLYVYTYVYGGGELTADAARFFEESRKLKEIFWINSSHFLELFFSFSGKTELAKNYLDNSHHWFHQYSLLPNDSRNVIRLNTLIHFISNGELLVHFYVFTFLSFLGGLDLAKWLKKHSNAPMLLVLVICLFTPSVVFWTSSILKEPLLIIGFIFVLRGFFDDLTFFNRVWRLTLGILLMILFKPYVLLCFLPFIGYLLLKPVFNRFSNIAFWKLYFPLLGMLFFVTSINEKFVTSISLQQEKLMNIRDGGLFLKDNDLNDYHVYFENRSKFEIDEHIARLKEPVGVEFIPRNDRNNRQIIQLEEIGQSFQIDQLMTGQNSGIELTRIKENGWTMIKMIPEVLFNVVIRPLPHDNGSWLKYLAFLENLFLLFWVVLGFIFVPRKLNFKEKQIVYSLIGFSFLLILIVGWTTPVLGALVRYKIPAIYALAIVLCIKTDFKKLHSYLIRK